MRAGPTTNKDLSDPRYIIVRVDGSGHVLRESIEMGRWEAEHFVQSRKQVFPTVTFYMESV